jgi:uncharacterized protein GlcG (DUF336 family)
LQIHSRGEIQLVGAFRLAMGGRLAGAVGVAGLLQGVDEKAAEAGIAGME